MKFYEFLSQAKDGLYHTKGEVRKFDEKFYKELVNTVPFVFMPSDKTEETPATELGESLDLPFKTCFFEVLGHPITVLDEAGRRAGVDGVFIHEYSPRQYNIILLIYEEAIFSVSGKKSYSLYAMDGENMGVLSAHALGLVKGLLNKLAHQEAGFINPRYSFKMKVNGEKIQHRITKIIYVAPKKQRAEAQAHATKEIDWSHRFEVRGHWRVVDTIGKDRDGLYCVEGYTWVKEHIRGPEDMPLVKKTRVVQS